MVYVPTGAVTGAIVKGSGTGAPNVGNKLMALNKEKLAVDLENAFKIAQNNPSHNFTDRYSTGNSNGYSYLLHRCNCQYANRCWCCKWRG